MDTRPSRASGEGTGARGWGPAHRVKNANQVLSTGCRDDRGSGRRVRRRRRRRRRPRPHRGRRRQPAPLPADDARAAARVLQGGRARRRDRRLRGRLEIARSAHGRQRGRRVRLLRSHDPDGGRGPRTGRLRRDAALSGARARRGAEGRRRGQVDRRREGAGRGRDGGRLVDPDAADLPADAPSREPQRRQHQFDRRGGDRRGRGRARRRGRRDDGRSVVHARGEARSRRRDSRRPPARRRREGGLRHEQLSWLGAVLIGRVDPRAPGYDPAARPRDQAHARVDAVALGGRHRREDAAGLPRRRSRALCGGARPFDDDVFARRRDGGRRRGDRSHAARAVDGEGPERQDRSVEDVHQRVQSDSAPRC